MARITVIPLFKDKRLSAGDTGTSDPIDLRYCANQGYFSLFQRVRQGTFGSAGTTTFKYLGCATETGTYIQPVASGTIGTASTASTTGTAIVTFEPELMPWMKIIATQVGTGTAGADSVVNAELIVQ
jgi:hypothetical protein